MAITIVLADDHPMIRAGLVFWFAEQADFRLAGEAGDGSEAWRMIREHEPDVALMDIEMPEENGILVTQRVKDSGLATKVLMLTSYKSQQYVLASLRAGASGFILKTTPLDELEKAIVSVKNGNFYLDPKISRVFLSLHTAIPLSEREREVLVLTAQGISGKDAAGRLNISERTVEAHLRGAYSKLGARNKTEAILIALKSGVILLDELAIEERDFPA